MARLHARAVAMAASLSVVASCGAGAGPAGGWRPPPAPPGAAAEQSDEPSEGEASATAALPVPEGPVALQERAKQMVALFRPDAVAPEGLLTPGMKPARLVQIMSRMTEEHGPLVRHELDKQLSEWGGQFWLVFERGVRMPMRLFVQDQPPHLVRGLWFDDPVPDLATLDDVAAAFGKLPGKTSLAICRLDGPHIRTVASHNADEPMAIGSTFKLYVLGELVRQVARGQRRWEQVVRLEERYRSLPSGVLHRYPVGAPLTLHSLATQMVQISDNTATDHLLFSLGRQRVETTLKRMGNEHAERNVPLISTAEMFRLKDVDDGRAARAYVDKDAKARRAFLRSEVARLSLDQAEDHEAPRLIDKVEWFASTDDLCRALAFLKAHTDAEPAAMARSLLALNPGILPRKHPFAYAGYKGGSEPGVRNYSYLLRTHDGDWWAAAATWNDPKATKSPIGPPFLRALQILAAQHPAPAS